MKYNLLNFAILFVIGMVMWSDGITSTHWQHWVVMFLAAGMNVVGYVEGIYKVIE